MADLSDYDKATYMDLIDLAQQRPQEMALAPMLLDGEPCAVVVRRIYNRFTKKPEGLMAMAILVDDDTAKRLTQPDGTGPATVSPHDVTGNGPD